MRRYLMPNLRLCATVAALALTGRGARAVSLWEDDHGTQLRWDTTVQQTEAFRLLPRDQALLDDPNADDGDRHFTPGLISDRTDLFSELDYDAGSYGARLSAAGWYDPVYLHGNNNDLPATFNPISTAPGQFPDAVKRLEGTHAELLDGFVHGKTTLDGLPISVRLGRHTLTWGESLFFAGSGVASIQAPQDIIRARSVPASTAKELFLPVAQLSALVEIDPGLSIECYEQLEWRRDRLPGVESYFSTTDILDQGGERILLGGKALLRARDETPDPFGQFGVGVVGTAGEFEWGVYAMHGDSHSAVVVTDPAAGAYHLAFPTHLAIYGVSASTFLASSTLAGEMSVHTGVPVAPASLQRGDPVPRADSLNGQVSLVSQLSPGRFWASADLLAEVAANTVLHADAGAPSASQAGRTTAAFEVQFAPHYFHVAAGTDLTPSVTLEYGVLGRSAIDGELQAGNGALTASLEADYRVNWHVQLGFTHFIGAPSMQPLADRDFTAISVVRTF